MIDKCSHYEGCENRPYYGTSYCAKHISLHYNAICRNPDHRDGCDCGGYREPEPYKRD